MILLAIGVLMVYQGFTGNSAMSEIQKLISGQPAFGKAQYRLIDRISGAEVRVNSDLQSPYGPDGKLLPGLAPQVPPGSPANPGGGGDARRQ